MKPCCKAFFAPAEATEVATIKGGSGLKSYDYVAVKFLNLINIVNVVMLFSEDFVLLMLKFDTNYQPLNVSTVIRFNTLYQKQTHFFVHEKLYHLLVTLK